MHRHNNLFAHLHALAFAVVDAVAVRRDLKSHSLASLCRALSNDEPPSSEHVCPDLLEHLCVISNRAGRLIPGSTCLTQSLALKRCLARNQIKSILCIGAGRESGEFGAHAWIEVNGMPVNSGPDIGLGFQFRFVPESTLESAELSPREPVA